MSRLITWLRRNLDGDSVDLNLDALRQMDALVEGMFLELATSRAVGPGIKRRLTAYRVRWQAQRAVLGVPHD